MPGLLGLAQAIITVSTPETTSSVLSEERLLSSTRPGAVAKRLPSNRSPAGRDRSPPLELPSPAEPPLAAALSSAKGDRSGEDSDQSLQSFSPSSIQPASAVPVKVGKCRPAGGDRALQSLGSLVVTLLRRIVPVGFGSIRRVPDSPAADQCRCGPTAGVALLGTAAAEVPAASLGGAVGAEVETGA